MAQPEQFTNVVWTDDCGCYLTAKVPASVITRCPLHAAAPALLEALEAYIDSGSYMDERINQQGLAAIAQAQEVPADAQSN